MADTDGGQVQHVHPTWGREHVTGGPEGRRGECRCGPGEERLCAACGGEAGCRACGGGRWVAADAVSPGDRAVVIHNEEPESADAT